MSRIETQGGGTSYLIYTPIPTIARQFDAARIAILTTETLNEKIYSIRHQSKVSRRIDPTRNFRTDISSLSVQGYLLFMYLFSIPVNLAYMDSVSMFL